MEIEPKSAQENDHSEWDTHISYFMITLWIMQSEWQMLCDYVKDLQDPGLLVTIMVLTFLTDLYFSKDGLVFIQICKTAVLTLWLPSSQPTSDAEKLTWCASRRRRHAREYYFICSISSCSKVPGSEKGTSAECSFLLCRSFGKCQHMRVEGLEYILKYCIQRSDKWYFGWEL